MSLRRLLLLVPVAALGQAPPSGGPQSPASIVRITLAAEEDERQPITLPTEPENTVELDFPWPVEDWAGRGFTPDPEKYAGDFVIEATRGTQRLFVTPVAAGAHRVLHVVLAMNAGRTRSVALELIPAPASLAWRKVVFASGEPPEAAPQVSLLPGAPRARLRESSPESEIGLLRTLRLLADSTAEGARAIAAANPSLSIASLRAAPRSFGDFSVQCLFAARDATTGALGLCASVSNHTARRLLFDPSSWVVRAGDRVYPVPTVDFAGDVDPGGSQAAFLVLARGPDGLPTRLLPGNEFEVSVVEAGSANPRPVTRMRLEGFAP
ncbi:MAG TPA: hypothetical protein VII43_05420 [Opitutaceae bacterium]